MDTFFEEGDFLNKLLHNLKKNSKLSEQTKIKKEEEIKASLYRLKKEIISIKNKEQQLQFKKRYLTLKGVAKNCCALLRKAHTSPELERTLAQIGDEEEEQKEEVSEAEDSEHYTSASDTEFDSGSEEEADKMTKLDLSLALKIVKPFDGSAINLQSYIESIELLKDYAEGVSAADMIKFLKITLHGTARGALDGCNTIETAIAALKEKFGVKLTPKAVESEMLSKRQQGRSVTDFGDEVTQLSAKLAAAYVSQGTFASESAASKLVEDVAVRAFVNGLRDQRTQFFLQARNPTTLNTAISDALECGPESLRNTETTLWFNTNYRGGYNRGRGFSRGRGFPRGRWQRPGNYSRRGNYNSSGQNYRQNNDNRNNNSNSNQNHHGSRSQNQNRRGAGNNVNVAERTNSSTNQNEENQRTEHESNLIDLFR